MNTIFNPVLRLILGLVLIIPLLNGCMYPKSKLNENMPNVHDSVQQVQRSLDAYKEKKGVLPLANRDMDTPKYEQNVIDFKKMLGSGFLAAIPSVAYENGGFFQFVIVDPETTAQVKLLDLQAAQLVAELQIKMDAYYDVNKQWPTSGSVAPGFQIIDYEKLKTDSVQVKSPYSNMYLGCILDADGQVHLDYAPDIMAAMNKVGDPTKYPADLRDLLVQQSDFVPAASVPYKNVNNEPHPVFEE